MISVENMDKNKLEDQYSRLYSFNQRILDNAPVSIMVINDDGKIVSVNKHFLNFTGSDKPVGRFIYDVEFFKRENLVESYDELFKTGKPFSKNDCMTVNKNGETKFLNIIAVPMKDPDGKKVGALSMAIDNTENHLYHEKLLETNRLLEKEVVDRAAAEARVRKLSEVNQKILDNAPFSIVMLDASGAVIGANRMALELMDESGNPIIGRKLADTDEIRGDARLHALYEDLLKNGKRFYFDNLEYIRRMTGERRFLNIIAVPLIGRRGEIEGAISMALDNTQAIDAKNKLRKLNEELESKVMARTRELDKINQKLTSTLDIKSKYVADASHELRTPLTVIQGNVELESMKLLKKQEKVPMMHEVILGEVEKMRDVLSDLSTLYESEENPEGVKYAPVAVDGLVESVGRSFLAIAKQKGISLKWSGDGGKATVIGDALKLGKLLSNIVRNSIKYTDSGGWVDVRYGSDGNNVFLTVEDNGIGISENDLPHIFERFYRADKNRARGESGSGLGLSIAKLIADAHGGSIDVRSAIGKGSVFTVFIPVDFRGKIDDKLDI